MDHRPNIRLEQTCRGAVPIISEQSSGWGPAHSLDEAQEARHERYAEILTALIITVVLVMVLGTGLSDFWSGVVIGALSVGALGVGLLAVGACLGGARGLQ